MCFNVLSLNFFQISPGIQVFDFLRVEISRVDFKEILWSDFCNISNIIFFGEDEFIIYHPVRFMI